MTESRETQRRRQFRDRAKIRPPVEPAPAAAVVRRELCIIETPAECSRPRRKGSQLCAAHDEETDRLAAERLAEGWPAPRFGEVPL